MPKTIFPKIKFHSILKQLKTFSWDLLLSFKNCVHCVHFCYINFFPLIFFISWFFFLLAVQFLVLTLNSIYFRLQIVSTSTVIVLNFITKLRLSSQPTLLYFINNPSKEHLQCQREESQKRTNIFAFFLLDGKRLLFKTQLPLSCNTLPSDFLHRIQQTTQGHPAKGSSVDFLHIGHQLSHITEQTL